MRIRRLLFSMLTIAAVVAVLTSVAPAADFRVENAVFSEGRSQPESQGVTIFHGGSVYDFLSEPAEVIIFDKAHRQFLLLDVNRRVRSQISTDDVQGVVDRVKQIMAGHPNPQRRWLVNPSFEESFDRENSLLTLKSDSVTYRAQLQATDATVAAQYHEFSDWYTKFNVALNPSPRPPFPRMMLNEAIERRQAIAKEVHLTVTGGANETPIKVFSRHQFVAELNEDDTNRLKAVSSYLRSFQAVSLKEYRKR